MLPHVSRDKCIFELFKLEDKVAFCRLFVHLLFEEDWGYSNYHVVQFVFDLPNFDYQRLGGHFASFTSEFNVVISYPWFKVSAFSWFDFRFNIYLFFLVFLKIINIITCILI